MLGRMENVLRLPLVPLLEKYEPTIRSAMVTIGALQA